MVKKGVVLEVEKDKAIVLTNNNEYLYIKLKPQLKVGNKIRFTEYDIYHKSNIKFYLNKIVSVAASILIVLGIWFIVVNTSITDSKDVYAYLDINCNANISLSLDDNMDVIKAKGLNNEGIKTLKELKLENKDFKESTEVLINEALKLGYINNNLGNDFILISGSLSNSSDTDENQKKLKDYLKGLVSNIYTTDFEFKSVEIILLNPKIRDEAEVKKISMGLYSLYLEGEIQGLDLNFEELKNEGLIYLANVSAKKYEVYNYQEPFIKLEFDEENLNKLDYNSKLNMKINVTPNKFKKIQLYFDKKLLREYVEYERNYLVNTFNYLLEGKHKITVKVLLENGYNFSETMEVSVNKKDDENNTATPTQSPIQEETSIPNETKNDDEDYSKWESNVIYDTGDVVIHEDELWEAKWYHENLEPGTTGEYGVWKKHSEE
ncbi:MAG: anti-sigma factor domain-containing protein [Clostridiales bacterium]